MAEPPKITLNALQLLQITEQTLGQLREWVESKRGTLEDSHPHETVKAITSLHHARLLCGVRTREILIDLQKKQEAERNKVMANLPPQSRLNQSAAQVLGQKTAAKTIDDLWKEAGVSHYLETGRP